MAMRAGTRLGVYELRPLEGRGATAEVYRALDTRLGREVALKVIADGTEVGGPDVRVLARFEREAQILASLDHPNIARLHGVEHMDGVHALVMELVEGPTLADRIAAGPIAIAEAIEIAGQIASALEAAHERGIVHRDLKPSNIKFARDGRVKVLDFGVARLLRSAVSPQETLPSALTLDGIVIGTAAYMSPEQARGLEVDQRTDIWSFACVVYEMLTGVRVFAGDDLASTFAAVLTSDPDWSRVPSTFGRTALKFLECSLRKDAAQRPRHIGDVRLALEGVFETDPATTAARAPRRLLAAAAILAAAVAAAATAYGVSSRAKAAAPISYVLHAPEGTRFDVVTMEPYPSLSPDGRLVAFRAGAGAPAIWVQRLGETTARRLPNSDRGGRPFWSPDSKHVGFSGATRLQKISIVGDAAPQTVCECQATWGATWSPSGTILFADDNGLARVDASGGAVVRVTAIEPEHAETGHHYPVFLPDGRRFLFLVRSLHRDHRGIYVASLDAPNARMRLLPEVSNAAVGLGPDGRSYLFFVRDVTLLAQPFDTTTATLFGTPLVVAHRVVPGEGGRFAPFAAGGRALVFRQTETPHHRLRWFDRRGVPQLGRLDRVGSFLHAALTRDDTMLAVVDAAPESTKHDVWLYDVRRQVAERATTDEIGAFFPVWTPKGDRVIYASAREGPWHLFWRSRTGAAEGTLFAALLPRTKYPTDVSPDGQTVIFNGDGSVWALSIAMGTLSKLVDGMQGRVSPNGQWLAYSSSANGRREVYVTEYPRPRSRTRISIHGGEDPHWRGDGKELYFLDADQTLVAASLSTSAPLEIGGQQMLFRPALDERVRQFGPAYAPASDGHSFLVIERIHSPEAVLTVYENWALRTGEVP